MKLLSRMNTNGFKHKQKKMLKPTTEHKNYSKQRQLGLTLLQRCKTALKMLKMTTKQPEMYPKRSRK